LAFGVVGIICDRHKLLAIIMSVIAGGLIAFFGLAMATISLCAG
jgi:hypothetical protein